MKPESGPTSNRPSTREMILNYTLPGAWEATKRWLPKVNKDTILKAVGLGLPSISAGSALLPHTILAQEQPAGQIEQASLHQEDYSFVADALESPPLLETSFEAAHRRVSQNLMDLVEKERFCGSLNCVENKFKIDPNEVEEYINNPSRTVFNTFRVLSNARGEHALIAITDGPQGLRPELGNIESLEAAVKKLNQIDPDMMDLITSPDGYGVRIFGGSISVFRRYPDFFEGGFDRPTKGIFLNEESSRPKREPIRMMAILLVESSHLGWENVQDRLDDNPGIDKGQRLINWANKYREAFSTSEHQILTIYGNAQINRYKEYPELGI